MRGGARDHSGNCHCNCWACHIAYQRWLDDHKGKQREQRKARRTPTTPKGRP